MEQGFLGWSLRSPWCNSSRTFKSLINSIFTTALKRFTVEGMSFAKSVVAKVETVNLTNEEKRATAFREIEKMAKDKGLYYKNNWINILLELALEAIRGV